MYKCCLLFLCLAHPIIYGAARPNELFQKLPPSGRIMGGEPTTIEQVPYQVLVTYYAGQLCGGSVLTKDVILTAGHCTIGETASPFRIRAGATFNYMGGAIYSIDRIIEHPNYNNRDYDFALMYLKSSLGFGSKIQPIALPEQDQLVIPGSMAVTSGWGFNHEGVINLQLHKVTLPIVDQEYCVAAYQNDSRQITDRMLCAGYVGEGGKDACGMDNGGPLVVDNVIVGVTSFRRGCGLADVPSVWARVPAVADWIKENL